MRRIRSVEVSVLTAGILAELAKMQQLKAQIQRVQTELGIGDHIVGWQRPQRCPKSVSPAEFAAMPALSFVR